MSFRRQTLRPDKREPPPQTRADYVRIIGATFADPGNGWDAAEQAKFCAEVGVIMADWRAAPLAGLKRILNHLKFYRMVLLENGENVETTVARSY